MATKVSGLLTVIACLFFISYPNVQIFAAELGDGHNIAYFYAGRSKCNVSI